jgi:hypothetical protein
MKLSEIRDVRVQMSLSNSLLGWELTLLLERAAGDIHHWIFMLLVCTLKN